MQIGNDTRVLITGSAGVIGEELLALLSKRGASVLSVDRRPLSRTFAGICHVERELASDSLDELHAFAPEVIFHLAAGFERSKETADFWPINFRDNVTVHHRMVELAAAMKGISKVFVFASSYLIYASSLYMTQSFREAVGKLSESDSLGPRNLCGAAKYYGEKELEFAEHVQELDLRTVSARIFRVYGRGSKDIVSRWVRAALAGETVDLYNAKNRFDYIFAGDVAEGLVRLAEADRARGVVNLGTGRPRTVADVVRIIGGLASEGFCVRDQGVADAFEASMADVGRLRELTGWQPSTALEDGIEKLFAYERARGNVAGK